MSQIFISHRDNDHDNAVAAELKVVLEDLKYQVFLDADPDDGLIPGRAWLNQLVQKLDACRAVVVVHSAQWLESRFCVGELIMARSRDKAIITVLADETGPDQNISHEQCIHWPFKTPQAMRQRTAQETTAKVGVVASDLEGFLQTRGIAAKRFKWNPIEENGVLRSPYPGLEAFDDTRRAVFFGRDAEIDRTLTTLEGVRAHGSLVVVLGPSGAGKSSLVRAGVVPRLRHADEHRSQPQWIVTDPFRPLSNPFGRLATALSAALPGGSATSGREQLERDLRRGGSEGLMPVVTKLRDELNRPQAGLLVVVDQFEELLDDGKDCAEFLALLRYSVTQPDGVVVLATLQSDFLRSFQDAVKEIGSERRTHVMLGPIEGDLRDVIERPSDEADWEFAEGVVDEILKDVAETGAPLPLLAFTMAELFQQGLDTRENDLKIVLSEYTENVGRVKGAIERAAKQASPPIGSPDEDKVRLAFLSLARPTYEGTWGRRRVDWASLDEDVQQLLEKFVKGGLLRKIDEAGSSGDGHAVEVVHEALFRWWEPLAGWLDRNQEYVRFNDELSRAAGTWEERNRDRDLLWRGANLVIAQNYIDQRFGFEPKSVEFLEECRAAEQRARRVKQGVLGAVVCISLVVAAVFVYLAGEARKNERDAQALALAARSRELQLEDPALALAVAAESVAWSDTPAAESVAALIGARLAFADRWTPRDPVEFDAISEAVAISPRTGVAAAAVGKTVRVWAPGSDEVRELEQVHASDVHDVAFSRDGRWLASAGDDKVVVWGTTSWVPVHELDLGLPVRTVTFSPVADLLATGDDGGEVRLWDLRTAQPEGIAFDRSPIGPDTPRVVYDVAFRADGRLIASAEGDRNNADGSNGVLPGVDPTDENAGGRVVLWDVSAARAVNALDAPDDSSAVYSVAFHPDLDVLVAGHANGVIWHWQSPNTPNPEFPDSNPIAERLVGHTRAVRALTFDPVDHEVLASGGTDRTIRLWSVAGQPAERWTPLGAPLTEHTEWVSGLAFDADAATLLSSSGDRRVRGWAAPDGSSAATELRHHDCPGDVENFEECFVTAVAFGRDAAGNVRLASTGYDGGINVWDPGFGHVTRFDLGAASRLYTVAFTDDGRIVAGGDGQIVLADQRPGAERRVTAVATGGGQPVRAVAIDPTGSYVVSSGDDGWVRSWKIDDLSGTDAVPTDEINFATRVDALGFDVDGPSFFDYGTLVVGDGAGTVRLFDFNGGEFLGLDGEQFIDATASDATASAAHTDNVRDVALSRELLASGSADQNVWLWQRAAWEPADPSRARIALSGHTEEVGVVTFSVDASLLASGSNDGTARVWPVDLKRPVGEVLPARDQCRRRKNCFVLGAAFSPDGSMLATSGSDGVVRVWDSLWEPAEACPLAGEYVTSAELDAELPEKSGWLDGLVDRLPGYGSGRACG